MAKGTAKTGLAISGATGAVGSTIAARLAHAGFEQRLIVRDAARAPNLPAAEVAEASYEDPPALREALVGMETFFMVSAGESADRAQRHADAVDAAVEAGVERIVYLSFVSAAPNATFTFARDHWHTEKHIRSSGVRHTFLRDNVYLDYVPAFAGTDGVIRGPAAEGRVGGGGSRGHRGGRRRGAAGRRPRRTHLRRDRARGDNAYRGGRGALPGKRAPHHLPSGDARRGVCLARFLRRARVGGPRVGHLLRRGSHRGDGRGERDGIRADRASPDGSGRVLEKASRKLSPPTERLQR